MRTARILFFLLIFGVLGYFRERFFEHMNIIMAGVFRGTDEYAVLHTTMPVIMEPFSKWSYPALYYSKYIFTFLWVLVFYFTAYYTIKKLSENPKNILRFLTRSYLILLILAAVSMLAGYLINGTLKNDEYTLSRWLLGIAQSPIICLILLAAEKINTKSLKYDQ